ncbi:MAG: hypothetical protein A2X94_05030 [Bdellovibrionales bacterium GWB1_55_8]|nr:MAG: hypothetical protein A2X94_05030 [Bdellovibrionales bacterium GWB1_55_8]
MKFLNTSFIAALALIAFTPATTFAKSGNADFSVSTGANEGGNAFKVDFDAADDYGRKFGIGLEGGRTERVRAKLAIFPDLYREGNVKVNVAEFDINNSSHNNGDSSHSQKFSVISASRTGQRDLKDDFKLKTELIAALTQLDQDITRGEKTLSGSGFGIQAGAKASLTKKLSAMTEAELRMAVNLIGSLNDDIGPTKEFSGELLVKRTSGRRIYGGMKASSSSFGVQGERERNEFIGATAGIAF